MRTISAANQALLDAYRASARNLILFNWGVDGIHAFWSGAGIFPYNGQDYIGTGSLIEVEPADESIGNEANAVNFMLRAVPESSLTPDVLASIEDYAYKQTEVVISIAFFDPDTGAFVGVIPHFNGILDQIVHENDGQGGYGLVGRAESMSRDHTRTGYRRRSHEDQKTINANDGSLRHAAQVITQRIYWGRKGPEPTKGERTQRTVG